MPYEAPKNGFRTFFIVWLTQSVSVFGSALTIFAVNIWLVQELYPRPEQRPELAFALALINLAFALPIVFGAPLAGAWADRHDRKRTMLIMDCASGLLSLVMLLLLAAGSLNLWSLVTLVLLAALTGAFHNAAFDTSVAMLVPEAQLPRANGMMQTIFSLSGILSPAIAASLLALPALARQGRLGSLLGTALGGMSSGMSLAIGLDALTFFGAAAVLLFLQIPSPVRTDLVSQDGKTKKSIWADVKEGALFIWHRRPLLWLLGTFTVANLVASPLGVLQPLLVKFTWAADWTARGFTYETALALISSVGAAGGLAGGLLISAWGGLKQRRVAGVLIPLAVAGAAQFFLGFTPLLYLGVGMLFLLDSTTPMANAHSQAIWQTQTPREMQGRVFAVRRVIAQFSWPLSTAIAGWVGGVFNPGSVVAVLGVILAVFCAAQLFNPHLMRVEDKDYLDRLAVSRAVD